MQWFNVDRGGLGRILARKGIEFIIFELVQNTWDEATTKTHVELRRIPNTKYVELSVEDDNPAGFSNLSHAFTLFAESTKKSDPTKRGRFNFGEKLVLAMCEEAEIASTTGTVIFDTAGRRSSRKKREAGSKFTGRIRMVNEQIDQCTEAVKLLIPPGHVKTYFNGHQLESPLPTRVITGVTLPTEIGDEEGLLRPTKRKTDIELYQPLPGHKAMIYEMGIPVAETDDIYHVNVMQKVPLTLDRENVPPSYVSLVRSIVVDAVQATLTVDQANSTWVKDAFQTHGDNLAMETIHKVADLRFGEMRVAYDPSDPEANSLAVSKGYTVVHGGQLSKPEWDALKRVGAILPAGQVTPSPKPFSPGGAPLRILPFEKWTPDMKETVEYVRKVALKLIGRTPNITIASDITWPFAATYCREKTELIFNAGRLGNSWFEPSNLQRQNSLIIHELGHEYSDNHLSSTYHDALCELGAKLTSLSLQHPDIFTRATTITV